jgi:glycerol-3-phosphate acyltransferase PlsX
MKGDNMKVAIDAMGGDFAPEEIVRGAVEAAREYKCQIVLVGDETRILPLLEKAGDWRKKA